MWHALDGFWEAFHGLAKPVYMMIEIVGELAGISSFLLALPRAQRVRAALVRLWIVPLAVGVGAICLGVSHDVWANAQSDRETLHDAWGLLRGRQGVDPRISVGAYALAIAMLATFLIEWGWMTEEKAG